MLQYYMSKERIFSNYNVEGVSDPNFQTKLKQTKILYYLFSRLFALFLLFSLIGIGFYFILMFVNSK